MNTSTVILVQPPIEDFYLTKKRTIPYGLASIAACLIKNGYNVEIVDALATNKSKPIDYPAAFSYLHPFYGRKDVSYFSLFHTYRHFGYSYEHIGTTIRNKKPFMVGISSLFTAYADQAVKTAQAIKQFYPDCTIAVGGHHPTFFPGQVLSCDAVDFVIRGDGEKTMLKLCQALKDNTDVHSIPGIGFRENNGKVFISDPSWIKDLNTLPLPAAHLTDSHYYQRGKKQSITIVSSRGCPMRCSYCSVSADASSAPFRQRAAESVAKEIEDAITQNTIGFIDFEDENLCLNKPWFMRLFSTIKDVNKDQAIELRAMNGLYPVSLDYDIVSLLKASGFKTLNLSLGSASENQLKKFNRHDVRPAFEKALELAKTFQLSCVSYIIAAAPSQDAMTSLNDLIYLSEKRTLIGLSIYYPAPGSFDYNECKKRHILPESFPLMRSSALPVEHKTTRLEAATLLRLSRIINYMKLLIDTNGTLPVPEPFSNKDTHASHDRQTVSTRLLQHFLYDGRIRGVQPDGTVFEHVSDLDLTKKFLEQIRLNRVVGTR